MGGLSLGNLALLLLGSLPAVYSTSLRARDDVVIGDLSGIKKFAAIGDSYSAGIGAGHVRTEPGSIDCSRYNESYPSFLDINSHLGGSSAHTFDYLSCSGDESPAIKEQAERLGNDYDLITISAGGNDLGFSNIVQGCIYRLLFWDKCDTALEEAESTLHSQEFENNIKALLSEAGKHLSAQGQIYYTGYGTFFNQKTTACDSVQWTPWPDSISQFDWQPQYLTQDFRERTNSLVNALNAKLEKLVTDAGHTFVNYNKYSQGWLSRMCDAGVDESNVWNATTNDGLTRWNEMWFQMHKTPFATKKLIEAVIEMRRKRDSDISTSIEHYRPVEGNFTSYPRSLISKFIDDETLRVFHPTSITNTFIANLIVDMMVLKQANQQKIDISLKQTSWDDDSSSCPAAIKLTPTSKPHCSRRISPTSTSTSSSSSASSPTFTPDPYCNKLDTSAFPKNLFVYDVYDQFCEHMDHAGSDTGDVVWRVDDRGNKISHNRRDLEERSPPPEPEHFTDFNATLRFLSHTGQDHCAMKCKAAFGYIAEGGCGTTGSELYSMAHEATMDVGCGNYSYTIHSPTSATKAMQAESPDPLPTHYTLLELGPQKCWTPDSWGHHANVPYYYDDRELWDNYLLWDACGADKGSSMDFSANKPTIGPAFQVTLGGVPYWFDVWWREGCVLQDQTTQNMALPLGADQPDVTCKNIFRNDYLQCNNGGAGGYIDVGCLRYSFKLTVKNSPGKVLGG